MNCPRCDQEWGYNKALADVAERIKNFGVNAGIITKDGLMTIIKELKK